MAKWSKGLRPSSVKNQKGYDVGLEPSSDAALLNVWQTRHCLRVGKNTAGLNRLGNIQLHLSPLWIASVPDLVTPDSKHTPYMATAFHLLTSKEKIIPLTLKAVWETLQVRFNVA